MSAAAATAAWHSWSQTGHIAKHVKPRHSPKTDSDSTRKSSCRPRSRAGERLRKLEASGVARKVRNREATNSRGSLSVPSATPASSRSGSSKK